MTGMRTLSPLFLLFPLVLLPLLVTGLLEGVHRPRNYWGNEIRHTTDEGYIHIFNMNITSLTYNCTDKQFPFRDEMVNVHCHYVNVSMYPTHFKFTQGYHFQLEKRFALRSKDNYCSFYAVRGGPSWSKVGPEANPKDPKHYENKFMIPLSVQVRAAAMHICRRRVVGARRSLGGSFATQLHDRLDVRQVLGQYFLHMTIQSNVRGDLQKRMDDQYDDDTMKLYRNERSLRSVRQVPPDVQPYDDLEGIKKAAAALPDPPDLPPVPFDGSDFLDGGGYKGFAVKIPTVELLAYVDQPMMQNFSNDMTAVIKFLAETVNAADSFLYPIGAHVRLIGVRRLPDYPFEWDKTPVAYETDKEYAYRHYDRLAAVTNYARRWIYNNEIKYTSGKYSDGDTNPFYVSNFDGWSKTRPRTTRGIPDAIAVFTTIYPTDRESGFSIDYRKEEGAADNSWHKTGNVFLVKPHMELTDLTGREPGLSSYVTGGSLAHQIGHTVLGFDHPPSNITEMKPFRRTCYAKAKFMWAAPSSCGSYAMLSPYYLNGCPAFFNRHKVTCETHKQLCQLNADATHLGFYDMAREEKYDQHQTQIDRMRKVIVFVILADAFILVLCLFHLNILSSHIRMARQAHPHTR